MRETSYCIIGDGRVASHMARYLDLSRVRYDQWSRRQARDSGVTLGQAIRSCQTVLLLIDDSAIGPITLEHPELSGKNLVHFSGCVTVPGVQGMHPLCSFGADLYDLETYRSIPFICEPGPSAFGDLFPMLSNPSYTVQTDLKPLYHAVSVMAGPFTTLLWNKLFEVFEERLGLSREVAAPYMARVFANLHSSYEASSTGPLSRADAGTIRSNLEALADDPFQDVYRAFVSVTHPELLPEVAG